MTARAQIAEDRPEEVREAAEVLGVAVLDAKAARKPRTGLTRPLLGVALPVGSEAVVAATLLRVGQDLVGLVDFLELVRRPGALGDVGVVLAGELPVGRLDRLLVGVPIDAQDAVIVLEFDGHGSRRDPRRP